MQFKAFVQMDCWAFGFGVARLSKYPAQYVIGIQFGPAVVEFIFGPQYGSGLVEFASAK